MKKILVIQTSFIGDVIIATALVENLHQQFPDAKIDFLLRKGNESLLANSPILNKVHIWNKKQDKIKNVFRLIKTIRKSNYDIVVNLQRYAATGLMTALSGAKEKIGFRANPFSFLFTRSVKYEISASGSLHEAERNHKVIEYLVEGKMLRPKLYPTKEHFAKAENLAEGKQFITISPASVWQTKELPKSKWIELLNNTPVDFRVFILGGPDDDALGEEIILGSTKKDVVNLCGKLGLVPSAALMKSAEMNYVNDSAPLHICSAMNAPVTVFFCSTSPNYGFRPMSKNATILETKEKLSCRPCGFHGHKSCPKGHFKCGDIEMPYFSNSQ